MNPLPFLQKIGASLMIPVAAAARHESQVGRNPYHLRLPAFMLDTVRRGGELINGQYAASPDMDFATLYTVSRWKNNALYATPVCPALRAADRLTRSLASMLSGCSIERNIAIPQKSPRRPRGLQKETSQGKSFF